MALMSKVKFEELITRINNTFTVVRAQRTALNNATVALYNAYKFYTDGISATGDSDIELPMLQSAYDLDTQLGTGISEAEFFAMYYSLRNFIVAFETHLTRMVDQNFTDATIDGFLNYRAINTAATQAIVRDIWLTLKGQDLQARSFAKNSSVILFQTTATVVAGVITDWSDLINDKLYAASYYDPYMNCDNENYKGANLTIYKTGVDTVTITSLKVTGLNEMGILTEVDFGSVTLVSTTQLALDTSKFFVSVVSASITVTLTATTTFKFRNVAYA